MSKNINQWDTVRVLGVQPDYQERVALGMAAAMHFKGIDIIVSAGSLADLHQLLSQVFKVDPGSFLIEPVAMLHADGLVLQESPSALDIDPTEGGSATQQGEFDLAPAAQEQGQNGVSPVEKQTLAEISVENGKSPFAPTPVVHDEPEEYDDDEL